MSLFNDNTYTNQRNLEWFETAKRLAMVVGVFAALVLALLVVNGILLRFSDPLLDPRIISLRAKLEKHPLDEKLKDQFRQVDLQLRQQYFRRRSFEHYGSYLLLGGLAVFLLSLKFTRQFRRRLPNPLTMPEEDQPQVIGTGRQAVTILGTSIGCLLLLSALVFSNAPGADFAKPPKTAGGQGGFPSSAELAKNWPGFRGPAYGVVEGSGYPTSWDGAAGKNILWKTDVPLPGANSPIVWGDRIFLSGAGEHQREVYCFDAKTGKLLWRGGVNDISCADSSPLSVMEDTGYAAPTMTTDGKHVFAMFADGDLACFDFAGKRLWAKNLGKPDSMYGHAASLAMYHDRVIVQFDQGADAEAGKSAIMAFDATSGETIWQTKRPVPNSWSGPIVINTGKRDEIITCANPWVIAYNPDSGEELWKAECLSGDVAPTPVFAGGLVFAVNTGANLAAIQPGGSGDVTSSRVKWKALDNLPDIVSPLSDGKLVFIIYYGFITCYDAKTGAKVWEHDLGNSFRASPVLVGDTIYAVDEEGVTYLFKSDRKYTQVGMAKLGEKVSASPAFVNGKIYMRGKQRLYCIGTK